MAPKRTRDDDFVFTIDDDFEVPDEEEEVNRAQPPKKKTKQTKTKTKKNATEDDDDEEHGDDDGVWGFKDEDDGAMNPDFEFETQAAVGDFAEEEYEGWGFEDAKKGMKPQAATVDVNDIIRRRREKAAKKNGKTVEVPEEEDDAEAVEIDLDDDDEGALADDAFGMNAASDEEDENSDEEEQDGSDAEGDDMPEDDEEDEDASDDDSVATPTDHPDDHASDSDDDEEDAEEAAKRDAFFAPEEVAQPGKKTDTSSFQHMALSRPILRGLAAVGFTKPTPIQAKSIPVALMGKDVVGGAVTGSGKTGAFIVPILERLLYRPKKIATTRVVVLMPTRELAIQCHAVAVKLASHTDIKFTLAVGGLSLKTQEQELRLRPDVIIATPGRFIDHMRNSASFAIDTVEILVLDEADRMLEDGFADELNEILETMPKSRQTMLFSATMTSTVDRLVRVGMTKPVRLMVDSQKKTVTTLVQEFVRLRPGREEKRMGYLVHICQKLYLERTIIFFRKKRDAHRALIIFSLFGLNAAELHGDLSQTQRMESLENFRDGKKSFLLATDVASRGIDIKGVDTVINFEAPQSLEIYLHRVGRTARAGRAGVAVTLASELDRKVVKAAVKSAKSHGAKIVSRVIEHKEPDAKQKQIDDWEDEIEEIMQQEKEEKQMAIVEMQLKKGENIIQHQDEINSRPKRTWFESQEDKKKAKAAGREELNGQKEKLKLKKGGKLSNKDKKKLDATNMRKEEAGEKMWKKRKGDAEAAAQKQKQKGPGAKKGGKPTGKPKPKARR